MGQCEEIIANLAKLETSIKAINNRIDHLASLIDPKGSSANPGNDASMIAAIKKFFLSKDGMTMLVGLAVPAFMADGKFKNNIVSFVDVRTKATIASSLQAEIQKQMQSKQFWDQLAKNKGLTQPKAPTTSDGINVGQLQKKVAVLETKTAKIQQVSSDATKKAIEAWNAANKAEKSVLPVVKEVSALKNGYNTLNAKFVGLQASIGKGMISLTKLLPYGDNLLTLAKYGGKLINLISLADLPARVLMEFINKGTFEMLVKRFEDQQKKDAANDRLIDAMNKQIGDLKLAIKNFKPTTGTTTDNTSSTNLIKAVEQKVDSVAKTVATQNTKIETAAIKANEAKQEASAAKQSTVNLASKVTKNSEDISKVDSKINETNTNLAKLKAALDDFVSKVNRTIDDMKRKYDDFMASIQREINSIPTKLSSLKTELEGKIRGIKVPTIAEIEAVVKKWSEGSDSVIKAYFDSWIGKITAAFGVALNLNNPVLMGTINQSLSNQSTNITNWITSALNQQSLSLTNAVQRIIDASTTNINNGIGAINRAVTDLNTKLGNFNPALETSKIINAVIGSQLATQQTVSDYGKGLTNLIAGLQSGIIGAVNSTIVQYSAGIVANLAQQSASINQNIVNYGNGLTGVMANIQTSINQNIDNYGKAIAGLIASTNAATVGAVSAVIAQYAAGIVANIAAQIQENTRVTLLVEGNIKSSVWQLQAGVNQSFKDLNAFWVNNPEVKRWTQVNDAILAWNKYVPGIAGAMSGIQSGVETFQRNLTDFANGVNPQIVEINQNVKAANATTTALDTSVKTANQSIKDAALKVDGVTENIKQLNKDIKQALSPLATIEQSLYDKLTKWFKDNVVSIIGASTLGAAIYGTYKSVGIFGGATIQEKLGEPLRNAAGKITGLGAKVLEIWERSGLSVIASIGSFLLDFHNAMMLSVDLKESGAMVLSNLLEIFRNATGMKSYDDPRIDLNEVINKNFESMMDKTIGASNWEAIKMKWATLNRIYQASHNSLMAVQEMWESTVQATNTVGQYTAQIGNALRGDRVVSENSFPQLDENIFGNFHITGHPSRFGDKLEGVETAMNGMVMLTSNIVMMQNAAGELADSLTELRKAHGEALAKVAEAEALAKKNALLPDSFAEVELKVEDKEETNFAP